MQTPKDRKTRIFLSLTTPYLLFIIIPVIVLNIIAFQAISFTRQEETESVLTATAQSRDRLDTYMKSIETLLPTLQFNENLIKLDYLPEQPGAPASYLQWKALDSIKNIPLVADMNITMGIYYPRCDGFLTPAYFASNISSASPTMFQFGSSSFAEFRTLYVQADELSNPRFIPADTYLWDGQPLEGVLYSTRLSSNTKSRMFFLISNSVLEEKTSIFDKYQGALYLLDVDGNVIFQKGEHQLSEFPEISFLKREDVLNSTQISSEYIASYANSDYGLSFLSVVPKENAWKHTNSLQKLVLYLNLAAVLLTGSYIFFLVNRNNQRVSKALAALNKTMDVSGYRGGDVLEYLNQSVLELVSTHETLLDNTELQVEVLQAVYLDKLIQGSFENTRERQLLEKRSKLALSAAGYCTVVIYLESNQLMLDEEVIGLSDLATAKQSFLHKSQHALRNSALFYSNSMTQITAIFLLEEEEIPKYQQIVSDKLLSLITVKDEQHFKYKITGSPVFYSLDEVSDNHSLCHEEYLHRPITSNQRHIFWAEVTSFKPKNLFVFPLEFEKQLLFEIRTGDAQAAQQSIEELFTEYVKNSALSPKMRQIFLSQLKMTLLKSLQPSMVVDFQALVLELQTDQSLEKIEEGFKAVTATITLEFRQIQQSKDNSQRQEMLDYIDENFANPNLSLASMAEHFSLSDAYFSLTFKDVVGENFSSCLEQKRLSYAKELLLETEARVEDIALACGYNSTNTFRRAYRRLYGVSPSDTRSLGE